MYRAYHIPPPQLTKIIIYYYIFAIIVEKSFLSAINGCGRSVFAVFDVSSRTIKVKGEI